MHYIDTATAVAGLFVDPGPSQNPTVWDAAHANALQLEIINVIEHAGLTPTKGTNDQLLTAILTLGGAPLLGIKNPLINPSFLVAQTGNSQTKDSGSVAERLFDGWWFTRAQTGSVQADRTAFTPGQTDVPGNPEWFMEWSRLTSGSGTFRMESRMEDVRTFQGRVVTFSVWIKNNVAGSVTVTPSCTQHFGSGGSSNVETNFTPLAVNSTSWTLYTGTTTLPSISGKTIDANGGDYLDFGFHIDGADDFDLAIAKVQIEEGSVATAFEERTKADTLLRCLRYFERSIAAGLPVTWPPGSGTHPASGAIVTWGEGYLVSGSTYGFPALQRNFLVPKREDAVAVSSQHSMEWWPALQGSGTINTIEVDGSTYAVQSTLGTGRSTTGFPTADVNPGAGVQLAAHFKYEDLIF